MQNPTNHYLHADERVALLEQQHAHHAQRHPVGVATQAFASSSSSSSVPVGQQPHHPSPDVSMLPQWETIETTPPGAAKKRAKPSTDRTPGMTLLPMSRVESIASPNINSTLSKEAVYVISVATEEFIKNLGLTSFTRAEVEKRAITGYNDVAETVSAFEEFKFLKDSIPLPISLGRALETRNTIEQQREAYLDAVAEEAVLHKNMESIHIAPDAPYISVPQPAYDGGAEVEGSISDVKGKGKSKGGASANESAASKSKSHKAKPKPANGADTTPTTPSVRSERLKNKRAKMEADTPEQPPAETVETPHAGEDLVDHAVPEGDSNDFVETSISTAPAKKSKGKASKASKAVASASRSPNESRTAPLQAPAMSATSTPTPSDGAQSSSGYKIKIRPRQTSNQAGPLAQSASVENVSNSPAYASLYAPPSLSASPVHDEDQPSPNKRPRLSLHTASSPSQSHSAMNGLHSTNGSNHYPPANIPPQPSSSRSSSKKAKTSRKGPLGIPISSEALQAKYNIPGASEPPLWTRVPLPPPPNANGISSNSESTETHEHVRRPSGSPFSATNGRALSPPQDFRSALSPNASIPGRTIYSHSQS